MFGDRGVGDHQSDRPNLVTVSWIKDFSDNSSPVGVTSFMIPPDCTVDFGSRDLPGELTVVNAVCNPELVFDEGRALVSSRQPEIGVSARIYYTSGDGDERLDAITDSKIVPFGQGTWATDAPDRRLACDRVLEMQVTVLNPGNAPGRGWCPFVTPLPVG